MQQLYEAEEQRKARIPGVIRAITLLLGARQSKLLHGLILTNVEAKIEAPYEEFNDAVGNRTLEKLNKFVAMGGNWKLRSKLL